MKRSTINLTFGTVTLIAAMAMSGGPSHMRALAQSTAPTASAPSQETTIKALQAALNKQGIAVKADGVLNDATRAAIRQYQTQHHLPVTGEPDNATLEKLGVADQRTGIPNGAPSAGPGMGGPGMGSPGMMGPQMMPGTTGGTGPVASGQMGMMMHPMMGMMGGMGPMGAGQMGMPGMMGPMISMGRGTPMGMGPGAIYGVPRAARADIDPDQAKAMVARMLAWHGNPRLKLGETRATEFGEIVVEITTREGSLVQRLAIDRRTGALRQVD
ncbi:MAG: peptidoglycan-binding domain-containing protein [Alphaproteobacteria bacterium]